MRDDQRHNKTYYQSQRRAFYYAVGALMCVVVAFLLMILSVRVQVFRSGDMLPVDVTIKVHQPIDRDVDVVYRLSDSAGATVFNIPETIAVTSTDSLIRFRKEFQLPEDLEGDTYVFNGVVLDQGQRFTISEFSFVIVPTWLFWLFSGFSFLLLFVIAAVFVTLAWRSYTDDDATKDTLKKLRHQKKKTQAFFKKLVSNTNPYEK